MAKQNKQAKSTPEIYIGLVSDPKNLRRCLIEDINMVYSLFDSPQQLEGYTSYKDLILPTIQKRWDSFDRFVEKENEQTVLTYHEQLFGANPPKKQDLITTQLMVWHKLCNTVKNDCTDKTGTPKDPGTGRKSTILNCVYSPGEIKEGTADITTYQALQCLKLFRACIGDRAEITEGELKQYIIDHAADLRTRQDPWRIFQYYRPGLIAAKLLRRK
jgi:hypothetical protein